MHPLPGAADQCLCGGVRFDFGGAGGDHCDGVHDETNKWEVVDDYMALFIVDAGIGVVVQPADHEERGVAGVYAGVIGMRHLCIHNHGVAERKQTCVKPTERAIGHSSRVSGNMCYAANAASISASTEPWVSLRSAHGYSHCATPWLRNVDLPR